MEKIRQKTVVNQVMEKIRELIASGEYKSSEKLPTEGELAEMFGIGRSSIREAIKVFNYLGVLESRTAKGTFVCGRSNISSEALTWSILLGRDDYYEIIDMRGSIELWSMIELTARYAKGKEEARKAISDLEAQLSRMKSAIDMDNSIELAMADYDFHSTIIAANGNRLFSEIYQVLRSFMYEEIEKSHKDFADIKTIIMEHETFINAVKKGDPNHSSVVVLEHIDSIKRRLANVILG